MADKMTDDFLKLSTLNKDDNLLAKLHRTIFVGGIPLKSTETEVVEYLQKFASVESVLLPRSNKSGQLKGYAKVLLGSMADVEHVLAIQNHTIGGLNVGISKWFTRDEYLVKKQDVSSRKVYVKFKARIGVDNVLAYFRQFGEIEQFDVKCNPHNGRFRDFGYITYMSALSAQSAICYQIHTIKDEEVRAELCKPNFKTPHDYRHTEEEGCGTGEEFYSNIDVLEEINSLIQNFSDLDETSNKKSLLKKKVDLSETQYRTTSSHFQSNIQEGEDKLFKKKLKAEKTLGLPNSFKNDFKEVVYFRETGQVPPRPAEYKKPNIRKFKDPPLEKPCSKAYFETWATIIKSNHALNGNLRFKVKLPNLQPIANDRYRVAVQDKKHRPSPKP